MYKYEITLGDWSGDGHCISESYTVESNKTNKEIAKAYQLACEKVGFNFHSLCQDYEDANIPMDKIKLMEEKLGIDIINKFELDAEEDDMEYLDPDTYLTILFDFIKSQDPELTLTIINNNLEWLIPLPAVSFGYGLFSR